MNAGPLAFCTVVAKNYLARARVMAEELADLDSAAARQVEADLLDRAQRLAPARLRERARKAVLDADPEAAQVRSRRARGDRNVWFTAPSRLRATTIAFAPKREKRTPKSRVAVSGTSNPPAPSTTTKSRDSEMALSALSSLAYSISTPAWRAASIGARGGAKV